MIAVTFMSMPDARHLNAALIVKCVHCIQPLAKAPGNSRAMVLPLGRPL